MSLDYSKGYARDEFQVALDEQREKIQEWLRDKNVRAWKRALFMLYHNENIGTTELARYLDVNISTIYRSLKKQEISSKVKGEKYKNKMRWNITNYGRDSVYKMYEDGYLPSFLFEDVKKV